MKKYKIHKLRVTKYGAFSSMCGVPDFFIAKNKMTSNWNEVTCKNCLRAKKK